MPSFFFYHFSHILAIGYLWYYAYSIAFDMKPILNLDFVSQYLLLQEQNQILAGLIILSSFFIFFAWKIKKILAFLPFGVVIFLTFYERDEEEFFDIFHIIDLLAMNGILVMFFSNDSVQEAENEGLSLEFVEKVKTKILDRHNDGNKINLECFLS